MRHSLEMACRVNEAEKGDALLDMTACCSVLDRAVESSNVSAVWSAVLFPFNEMTSLCCGGTISWTESVHLVAAMTAHQAVQRGVSPTRMALYLYRDSDLSVPGSSAYTGAPIHGAMWQAVLEDGVDVTPARFWKLHDANCGELARHLARTRNSTLFAETCSHGIGHAALTLSMVRSHPGYSACRPFRRRAVPISEAAIHEAEEICNAAPSGFLKTRCADGLFHHFFKYTAEWDTRATPWHWPCSRVKRFASACFLRAMKSVPHSELDWVFFKTLGLNTEDLASRGRPVTCNSKLRDCPRSHGLREVLPRLDCGAAAIPPAAQVECFFTLANQATRWTRAPFDCSGAGSSANRLACIDGVAKGWIQARATNEPQVCYAATRNGTISDVSWCVGRLAFYHQRAVADGMLHLLHMGHVDGMTTDDPSPFF